MKVEKMRFRNLKIAVGRIEKVKNQFKYVIAYLEYGNTIKKCCKEGGIIFILN